MVAALLGPDDIFTSHRIDDGLTAPDVGSRGGVPEVREGMPVAGALGRPAAGPGQVRPHALRDDPATSGPAPAMSSRLPRWISAVSPRLFFGVVCGVAGTVVTLLAMQTVESWAIAPILGVLAGAVGWLAADATWGPRPPTDGPVS